MFIVIFLLATIATPQSEVLASSAVAKKNLRSLAARASFDDVRRKIGEIIAHESKAKPYSDNGIVNILSKDGVHILTSSVAWYRKSLGVGAYHNRKMEYISDAIRGVIASEDPLQPLLDKEIAYALQEQGFELSEHNVWAYRLMLGILPAQERLQENAPEVQGTRVAAIKIAIQEIVANEDTPLTDEEIVVEVKEKGINARLGAVGKHRKKLGISPSRERGRTETHEKAAAKVAIREIIAAESSPLTDAQIVDELNKRGIKLSGSAVYSYRTELGIPSSRQRGRIDKREETAIQAIVASDDTPLTDKQVAAELNKQGIGISDAAVRRYRTRKGIPSYWQRVKAGEKTAIQATVENEDSPLTDEQIADELNKQGIDINHMAVHKYRTRMGIPSYWERKQKREETAIQAVVANEDTPLTDKQIATELNKQGIKMSKSNVQRYRTKMNIPSSRQRGAEKQ